MKKLLLLCVIICFQNVFSQVSIERNKLVKDGVKYKFSKYDEVFRNDEARDYFKKAKSNKTLSEVFAYTGGFGLGFGLAQALQSSNKTVYVNGYPQTVKVEKSKGAWAIVGAGVGLIGIGIPFALAAEKNAKKAIAIENGEPTAFRPYFKLETASDGLALSYHF